MIDDETGLKMTMAVQSKPQNPRVAESNVFQIVTWTKGLGDRPQVEQPRSFPVPHPDARSPDLPAADLRTSGARRSPSCATPACPRSGTPSRPTTSSGWNSTPPATSAPRRSSAPRTCCIVELLTYEDYITGHVYSFSIFDRSGTVIETQGNIYGEDYAEHLATTAFTNHRLGIGADNR